MNHASSMSPQPAILEPPLLFNNISAEAYQIITEIVYRHSRIRLGAAKQAMVTGRLMKRLRELNLDSFEAYCDLLQSEDGAEELGPLVDLISTNHTNFFREIRHIEFLQHHVLPEAVSGIVRHHEIFRVWSAACSSGEEPYTIAIVLAEFARRRGTFYWQIEASDISSRVIERAKSAIYSEDRVRLPEPDLLQRYFQKGTGSCEGYYRVKDSLRRGVKFHRLNLLQPSYPLRREQHVIFCRNVMIYFDTPTQQELVMKLTSQLAPGGYLIVGHSESLLGVQHTLQSVGPGIYRKDEG
jgi:chemotaxis protein methyltransferase CheR